MKSYILVIDSGIGGVSVLNAAMYQLPHACYIYYADNGFAPYGSKSKDALLGRLKHIIKVYQKLYKLDLVIIACNTATVSCLDQLKKWSSVPVLGIRPPIKQALKYTKKKVVVLATPLTIRTLKTKYNDDNIIFCALPDMAQKIDKNLSNLQVLQSDINSLCEGFATGDIGAVVLGCTHYYFIKSMLKKNLPKARFFESSNFVAIKAKNIVGAMGQTDVKGQIVVQNSLHNKQTNLLIKKYIKNALYQK